MPGGSGNDGGCSGSVCLGSRSESELSFGRGGLAMCYWGARFSFRRHSIGRSERFLCWRIVRRCGVLSICHCGAQTSIALPPFAGGRLFQHSFPALSGLQHKASLFESLDGLDVRNRFLGKLKPLSIHSVRVKPLVELLFCLRVGHRGKAVTKPCINGHLRVEMPNALRRIDALPNLEMACRALREVHKSTAGKRKTDASSASELGLSNWSSISCSGAIRYTKDFPLFRENEAFFRVESYVPFALHA